MIRLVAIMLLGMATLVSAQPSATPLGPSVLDTGSQVMGVHGLTLPAPDGGAIAYRIGILVPRGPAPEDGFPVIYMLDGQSVLARLDDAALSALPQANPAVIVTVGYDTDQRFASAERTRDYTPPSPDGTPVADPRGRTGGGAKAFMDLLETRIIPHVASIAPVDPAQSTLWGHSYGGLFVLWAASQADIPFANYVAASPSLWWDNASFLTQIQGNAGQFPNRPLSLHKGALERQRASNPDNPNAQKLVQMRAALPEDAFETLAETLAEAGVPITLRIFPDLSHGESFAASVDATLTEILSGSAPD